MMNLLAPLNDPSVLIHAALIVAGFAVFWRAGHLPPAPQGDAADGAAPRVSVIIPARNEAARLPALLASLKTQTAPPLEVIVVDDHSSDDTAARATEAGAHVVTGAALPPGWTGKTWACQQGAGAARGDLLLFLDADVTLEPEGIARLLAAQGARGGAVSAQPDHDVRAPHEELSAFFNVVQMIASNAFTVFGGRLRQRLFGPVMLIPRADYDAAGGHESVKGHVLENFFFSEVCHAREIPVSCFAGRGAVSVRMYPEGLGSVFAGWSKAFAKGAGATTPAILILTILWLAGALGTARHGVTALCLGDWAALPALGVPFLAYALQIHVFFRRAGRFSFLTALLYPVPLLFFVVVFARSLALRMLKRRVTWKGRAVP